DLSSLRLLGTVGEPINPEAWMWYHKIIGGGRCPVVDTWFQTETGSILITPLPGAIPTKPGSATLPFFGIDPAVVDEKGHEVGPNVGGKLIIRRPWPSMLRTIYGDKARYRQQYWSEFKGNYLTGDGARRDEDDYFWIVGRIDDVLNVAGHRLRTSEIESALVSHARVAEAAVVGRPDELKGQAVVAFVTVKAGVDPSGELRAELRDHVAAHIGAIAKPDEVRFAEALPKTRSGKIMRRLLKEIASGAKVTGDNPTLEDFRGLTKRAESEKKIVSFIRTGLREIGLKIRRQRTRMVLRHEKRLLQKSEIILGREGTSQAANFPELRNEIVALKKLEQEQKEVALRIARIEEGIKKVEAQRQANAREQSEAMAKLEVEKKPIQQRRNDAKNAAELCEREVNAVERRIRDNDEADHELLRKLSELQALTPPPADLETQIASISARRARLPEERAELVRARLGSSDASRIAKEKLVAADEELSAIEKNIAKVRAEYEMRDRGFGDNIRAQQDAVRDAKQHHQVVEERKNPAYLN